MLLYIVESSFSSSIIRRPIKFIFIKRPVRTLPTYKDLSVYCTFAFESAGFLQSIEFGVQRTWKGKYTQKILFPNAKNIYFKGRNTSPMQSDQLCPIGTDLTSATSLSLSIYNLLLHGLYLDREHI